LSLLDLAATEAAKTAVASLAGAAIAGAGRLLAVLRRRIPVLPADPARLAELIRQHAERDPAFAAEIYDGLAVAAGTGAMSPFPPDPFVDRDGARAAVASGSGVWLVAGSLGAGKTAFVRRIAHDVAGRFPGGQVYVDLDEWRDGDTLRTAEIERHILGQLGVDAVGVAEPELSQQYLSALLRRRFVLILENVLGVEEARRLAQPWPCSLVLVTTRGLTDELRIWSTPDQVVRLHGLDESGAWELLASRCGEAALAVEPDAARRLLERCDRMPFAILQIGSMVDRRRGEPGVVTALLDEFVQIATDEGVIRRCLDDAFDALAPSTLDGLLTLAAHPGEDFTSRGARALLGASARRTVDELIDACLLELDRGRLRLHHLVRQHADARGASLGDARFDGLLAFYRDRAVAADLSTGDRLRCYSVPDGLEWPSQEGDAIDWLEIESGVIVDLVKQAHTRGRHVEVVQLCGALEVLLRERGHHWRCAEAFEWGIRSATEPAHRARLHAMLGRVCTLLHVFDRAAAQLDAADGLLVGLAAPRLESSIMEFHARLHEERAEHHPDPDYSPAIGSLRRAVDLDVRAGLDRPLALHRRMLANLLVKAGQPADALALLAEVATMDDRNNARVRMVLAKAHTALGDLAAARVVVAEARALVERSGATQYEMELADIEAEIAYAAGDVGVARARWGWIVDRYHAAGHPLFSVYLAKLDRLPPPPR
jgi:hypothetical protein